MGDYEKVVEEYEREGAMSAVAAVSAIIGAVLLAASFSQPSLWSWVATCVAVSVAGAAGWEVVKIRSARSARLDRLIREGRIRRVR